MLLHLAMILQISGFLLATIFGGILLNREMFGRFANKANTKIRDFTEALYVKSFKIAGFASLITKSESARQMTGSIMLRGVALFFIGIGWEMDIRWLFWIGVVIASLYVLLSLVFIFLRLQSRFGIKGLWLYPLFLCWSLIVSFFLAPAAIFIYLILLYVLLLFLFVLTTIAKEDALKKGLIIFGSVLIVTGIIIETAITW
jgi:hypothetical protein